ncbi:MAG: hypothetical protein ACREPA_12215, partial [Candidatus Dormibacteraceae bacterium]
VPALPRAPRAARGRAGGGRTLPETAPFGGLAARGAPAAAGGVRIGFLDLGLAILGALALMLLTVGWRARRRPGRRSPGDPRPGARGHSPPDGRQA